MINVNVKRYDPVKDESYMESYEVEKSNKMKVLDALQQINDKYDANIAYRYSCRAGQCGSCAIKINGKAGLACKIEVQDNDTLEPLDFEVIKDLVVNRETLNQKGCDINLYMSSEDSTDNNTIPSIINPNTYEKTTSLRRCIDCYSCISMCPVIPEFDDYVGPYFMRALTDISFDPREDTSRSEDAVELGLYSCTSCGQCSVTCPKEINIYGKAIEKLRERVCRENEGPLEAHKNILKMVTDTGRSVVADPESKYPEGFIKEYNKTHNPEDKPKIAFFTGCMIDYKLPWIAEYTVKILSKLGYDVDIPEEQVCCGSPLIRTGQTEIIPTLVKKNYEAFKDYDIILTVCAGCGSTLKNNYPEYGVNLNVMDISEFLVDKVKKEDTNKLDLKVTYHDPCHLVRGQGISSQPREILKNINGVEFIEMEKPDQCCGAGGGVKSGRPEIADALSDRKVEMIDKLDVDHVITICPFCEFNITDALNRNNSNTTMMNLMELLNKAYE
ncbi:MAG: succinate dehydrogenase/fumarate reductase iron-sulfur subunit [Methanosphaera sp.]|nr:succinate dehydrogenase/fumarate reductase iron-sulfur subunit [Methanosphaera sp.]